MEHCGWSYGRKYTFQFNLLPPHFGTLCPSFPPPPPPNAAQLLPSHLRMLDTLAAVPHAEFGPLWRILRVPVPHFSPFTFPTHTPNTHTPFAPKCLRGVPGGLSHAAHAAHTRCGAAHAFSAGLEPFQAPCGPVFTSHPARALAHFLHSAPFFSKHMSAIPLLQLATGRRVCGGAGATLCAR